MTERILIAVAGQFSPLAKTTALESKILSAVARADIVASAALRALPFAALAALGAAGIFINEEVPMHQKIVRYAVAAAGAVAGLYGGWSPALKILCAMMAADYLTGVLVAVTGKSPKTEGGGLSSRAGFVGIARKGFIMLIVLVATLLDRAVGGGATVFQTACVFYYIANEGLSILENAEAMGVPFPAFMRERLESMRAGKDGAGHEN